MIATNDFYYWLAVAVGLTITLGLTPLTVYRLKHFPKQDWTLVQCFSLKLFGVAMVVLSYFVAASDFNTLELANDQLRLGRMFPLPSMEFARDDIGELRAVQLEGKGLDSLYFIIQLKDGRELIQSGFWRDPIHAHEQLSQWWAQEFLPYRQSHPENKPTPLPAK